MTEEEYGTILRLKNQWNSQQITYYHHLTNHLLPDQQKIILTHLSVPLTARKLVAKLGVAWILGQVNHKAVDWDGDYTVYEMPLHMNFLRMRNPSTGEWHFEALAPGCHTVRQALNWRNNGWFIHAEQLT